VYAEPLISDHWVGILGLVIGLIGLPVGIVGAWFGFRSDRKMKTAQQAQRRVEQKLFRHMATRSLEGLAKDALALTGKIRRREWDGLAESGENLSQRVLEFRGAWGVLLEPLEKDKLDAAAMNIQQFIESAPTGVPALQPSEEQIRLMLVRCRRLTEVSSEVAGRLGVELMQNTEDLT
jgi:hypothetical protein